MKKGIFSNLQHDIPASIVVFFVALPLCLGIALASNAPLFSGIIAGVIGGVIVGIASGSPLGVSGPAAGLVAIVLSAVETLGSFEAFLLSSAIAGVLQLIAGYLRGGIIAYYFPSSVIKGMLTGIGIIIVLKQIPHLLGYDVTPLLLLIADGMHKLDNIRTALNYINPGVVIISALSLAIIILWDTVLLKKHKIFNVLQAPLVVVSLGIFFSYAYEHQWLAFTLEESELVRIPDFSSFAALVQLLHYPDFSQWSNPAIYQIALVIALIASIETLLCVEATDRLDPHKRITPTNQELRAQGLGNLLSALIGGLPITQVIVRSSANITFGAKTKMSAILHGFLLLICVVSIPWLLNRIPLATLAAILTVVGFKLAKPVIFREMYRAGWDQFIPFMVTVIGIVVEDLLFGITIGFATAIFIILRNSYMNSHDVITVTKGERQQYHLRLADEVTFLNKGSIINELKSVPKHSDLIIDGSASKFIDTDVLEIIHNFVLSAKTRDIQVTLEGIPEDTAKPAVAN